MVRQPQVSCGGCSGSGRAREGWQVQPANSHDFGCNLLQLFHSPERKLPRLLFPLFLTFLCRGRVTGTAFPQQPCPCPASSSYEEGRFCPETSPIQPSTLPSSMSSCLENFFSCFAISLFPSYSRFDFLLFFSCIS